VSDALVANNPAGRLRDIFAVFHEMSGSKTHSEWWSEAAQFLTDGADGISARAEAATLFREIEIAVTALPLDDDPATLLAKRQLWAAPIFGIDMLDHVGHRLSRGSFVDPEALASLAHLHSILRREAPEYRVRNDADLVAQTLQSAMGSLSDVRTCLLSLDDTLPGVVRAQLVRSVNRAIADIRFVRFRGYARLHQDAVVADVALAAAAQSAEVQESAPLLERFSSITAQVKQVVADVEAIFIPGASGVAYGILTGDLIGATLMWVGARRALGPVAENSETLALPPGTGEQNK
jgi:hypothetical protein